MLTLIALSLTGCAPQQAEISGTWFAWLGANSSSVVADGDLDLSEATTIDCKRLDPEELGYIGNSDPNFDCTTVDNLQYNTWLQDDGYYALSGEIDPWRTEAIVNSEGVFQLTSHIRLGDGEDFRFHFSILPNFAPTECVEGESGVAELQYVDGASWLDKWSEDEGDYNIYYLNAGAYQTNPGDSDDVWYTVSEWRAGYGAAKFAGEDFSSQPTAYEWYDPTLPVYSAPRKSCLPSGGYRLFYEESYFSLECEDVGADPYADVLADIQTRSPTWVAEMTDVYGATGFEMKVEDNAWRPDDGVRWGLDGWVDVNTSWVRIKKSSDLSAGGEATGDFQIVYEATDSGSHLMVKGEFTTNVIREDKWGYPVLEDELREESGQAVCGGAAAP